MTDDTTHERYVANIVAAYGGASEDQQGRGRNWYPTARQIATLMAEGDTKAGAGVIAALSPQKAWYLNQRIAQASFDSGEARGNVGNATAKAQRIMLGEDPLEVLPDDSKTWNFYRSIMDPTDPDPVCVDRHAWDIALGVVNGSNNRGITKRRYAEVAHAYREAARRLGEIPSALQAITWCYWTETVLGDLPRRPGKRNVNK